MTEPLGAHEVGEIADADGDGAAGELAERQLLLLRLLSRRFFGGVAILEAGLESSLRGMQSDGGADAEAGGAGPDAD